MQSRNLYPVHGYIADGKYEIKNNSSPTQSFGLNLQPWSGGFCPKSLTQGSMVLPISLGTTNNCTPLPQYRSLGGDIDPEFPLYRVSCGSFSIGSEDPWRQALIPKEKWDCRVSCSTYDYPPLGLLQGSTNSSRSSGRCSVQVESVIPNKPRIRWTQDLHEKFVECVNHLGGAEKATPKAILELMDSDGLTIYHIKSHLQKYRVAKYIPDSRAEKNKRRMSLNEVPELDLKGGLKIKEALQLQLEVQRQLHEQLEIQRKLQLQIEEQARQLRVMFEQQQKTTKPLSSNGNDTGLEGGHSL
ncbi:hypothetical protein SAY86_007683 [Trapa natans]|uniref:HTH myb-type domain-containing protein n=1 Tax=Trapa natans TaxID=22666 RepID=A0AAN7LEY3_TRANT|nr:hypothetical protein SAY86_007683 [Trapa natans]